MLSSLVIYEVLKGQALNRVVKGLSFAINYATKQINPNT
jgi:hypothetical protein